MEYRNQSYWTGIIFYKYILINPNGRNWNKDEVFNSLSPADRRVNRKNKSNLGDTSIILRELQPKESDIVTIHNTIGT